MKSVPRYLKNKKKYKHLLSGSDLEKTHTEIGNFVHFLRFLYKHGNIHTWTWTWTHIDTDTDTETDTNADSDTDKDPDRDHFARQHAKNKNVKRVR